MSNNNTNTSETTSENLELKETTSELQETTSELQVCFNPFRLIWTFLQQNNISFMVDGENIYNGFKKLAETYDKGGMKLIIQVFKLYFNRYKHHPVFEDLGPVDICVICSELNLAIYNQNRYKDFALFVNGKQNYYTMIVEVFDRIFGKIPRDIIFTLLYLSTMVIFKKYPKNVFFFDEKYPKNVFFLKNIHKFLFFIFSNIVTNAIQNTVCVRFVQNIIYFITFCLVNHII